MVQKRPFDNEELYYVTPKHPKQLEHGKHLVSILDFISSEGASRYSVGQDVLKKLKVEVEQTITRECIPEISKNCFKEIEVIAPGHIFPSSWSITSKNEDAGKFVDPLRVICAPEDRSLECLTVTKSHSRDSYFSLLEYSPRKLVPVGPDHQAIIPEWCPPDKKISVNSSVPASSMPQYLDSGSIIGIEDRLRLIGSCVLPMPETAHREEVGITRSECYCQDADSVRCNKQHIAEAREKLKDTLGMEMFLELGFCHMGEVVAKHWSTEDEHEFHKVVFSNPASFGKNFWEKLSLVFPSRTKKEIVSYYFNVFMTRRRAEQNRCCPMNIDSDDDEWQGSDDDDDESDAASQVYEAPHYFTQTNKYSSHDYNEDATYSHDSEFDMNITKPSWKEWVSDDVQDNSCSSSDSGAGSSEFHKTGSRENWPVDDYSPFSDCEEYVLEPCDTKLWDIEYMDCLADKFNFLPTCSVIEDVLGNEEWNFKGTNGKGFAGFRGGSGSGPQKYNGK